MTADRRAPSPKHAAATPGSRHRGILGTPAAVDSMYRDGSGRYPANEDEGLCQPEHGSGHGSLQHKVIEADSEVDECPTSQGNRVGTAAGPPRRVPAVTVDRYGADLRCTPSDRRSELRLGSQP
jgi:hypothetical protein